MTLIKGIGHMIQQIKHPKHHGFRHRKAQMKFFANPKNYKLGKSFKM